ncbi:MAG: HAD-IIB family hydrolase [Planctomycetales bacterium]|nr:HAD-IIB family hydrolase [Planctomycetales bacterium]
MDRLHADRASARNEQAALRVLSTDLDGTLIPLPEHGENSRDLKQLADEIATHRLTLVYVTGRHFESARGAMAEHGLPEPDWLICDVGTSIFRRSAVEGYIEAQTYLHHQTAILAGYAIEQLQQRLSSIDALTLQEPEKQGRFKLSYYADAKRLDELASEIRRRLDETKAPFTLIESVDPFNGDGLLDLLPRGVSKAYALRWWAEQTDRVRESIVFAGDSGNDLAALSAGYCAIVVGNADRSLAARATSEHLEQGWLDRLYLAQAHATSGVLEGWRWFRNAQRKG